MREVITLVCSSLLILKPTKVSKKWKRGTYFVERNSNDNTFPSHILYHLMLCKGCCDYTVKTEPFDKLEDIFLIIAHYFSSVEGIFTPFLS